MSFKRTLEPYASAWRAIEDHARGRGLIHGMQALELLRTHVPRGHWAPADAASFLRDMVEAGALQPVAKDLAGAGHSVRAFRGLQGGGQGTRESSPARYPDPRAWLDSIPSEAADAHVWTFEAVRS